MNILTAEEFMNEQGLNADQLQNLPWFDYGNLLTWLEDYSNLKAKLHVEAALKAANLNVKLLVDNNEEYREPGEGEDLVDYYQCGSDTVYVSSASILEAYPLTNIK
jgi:hypothetical protein